MLPCDTPRCSFPRPFRLNSLPQDVSPHPVSQRGASLGWSRDGSLGSGNTCFSLPSSLCLFRATASLFLVCLQPLPLCAAAPGGLIKFQHSLPNFTSLCSHHCSPTGYLRAFAHAVPPAGNSLPLHLPRLPLLVTIPQKRGPFSHPEPMWYPLKCELPRAGALYVSRGFVCLTYSRCSVSTH